MISWMGGLGKFGNNEDIEFFESVRNILVYKILISL